MGIAETSMGLALGGLRRLAGVQALDKLGLRVPIENLVRSGVGSGFSAVTNAGRSFASTKRKLSGAPVRQRTSSGKGLFDLTPTDEQQMLVDALTQFAADAIRPAARKADDACEAPRELVAQAADFGLASLGIPAELGGFVEERSAVTAVLAAEALAHGDLGIAAAIMSTGAVATVVALHGTETQQQMWLPAFLGDDAPHAALCLAEPRVLDDPMRPTTTARRDGEGWILDGTKSFVPNGTGADLLLVSATTPDGVGLFVVETSAAGVAAKDDPMMGARALATTQVALTAVRVGNDALLGDEPSRDVLADVVARGRVGWAALAVGCGQAVLDLLIPYVNERQAFGEPIAHRQGVAFEISDIAVELDGLRLATYRAASLADRSSDLTDTAFRRAAAVAAQLVTTHAVEIGSMGVQLLGGHGYVKEHPVERWYRDLRVAGLAHGVLAV